MVIVSNCSVMAADPDPCTGLRILNLAAAAGSLIVVLAEPLGCPVCGYMGIRWEVPDPAGKQRMLRHDPGE